MRDVLHESEARFRVLVEASPNGIFESDAEGHCIYVNKQLLNILEVSEEEIVNNSWADLMHPAYQEKITSLWYQTVKSGGKFLEEVCFTSSKGEDTWVFVHANALRKKSGEVTGYIGEIMDITQRKKTEETLKKSAFYLDVMSDALLVGTLDTKVIKINKASSNLWGYTSEELLGKSVLELFSQEEHPKHKEEMEKAIKTGKTSQFETIALTKEGKYVPVELKGNLLKDDRGDILGLIAVVRDIIERKKAEAILIGYEEEMLQKLTKYTLEKGRIYLTFDRKFNEGKDIIDDTISSGFNVVIISRTNPREIRHKFGDHLKILWLSKTKSDEVTVSSELSKLTVIIKELISPYTLIFLDRLDYLITQNGFERVLRFIQSLNDIFYFKNGVLVISVDPKTLKPTELSLLENEVTKVELKDKLDISTGLLDILRYVYKQNNQGKFPSYKDIGGTFDITKSTVRKRINKLKNEGLIIELKKGRFKLLELSNKAKAIF